MVSILLFTKKAFAILALSLVVSGLAVPKQERSDGPGFYKLDFSVVKSNVTNALSKRGEPEATLTPNQSSYLINIDIGTPAQSINAVLDTGSSDLWAAETSAGGDFSSSASSTYSTQNVEFSINYVKGSTSGVYGYDTVSIPGGPSLTNFEFGDVTNDEANTPAILGVGYEADETNDNNPFFQTYTNFPAALKQAGFISKNAYSIYLNDLNSASGAIIFGGKDTAKYDSLTTIAFTSSSSFSVPLSGIVTSDGTTHSQSFTGILDTGTTDTYLPLQLVQAITSSISGATYDSQIDKIVVPSNSYPGEYITYNFAGVSIQVPLTELVGPNYDSQGNVIAGNALRIHSNGQTDNINLLGDSFLRSAYVVFDLDDNVADIGQAKYTSDSNIVAI